MKTWHIWLVVAVIIGYLLGVKFPSTGAALLSKIGV